MMYSQPFFPIHSTKKQNCTKILQVMDTDKYLIEVIVQLNSLNHSQLFLVLILESGGKKEEGNHETFTE